MILVYRTQLMVKTQLLVSKPQVNLFKKNIPYSGYAGYVMDEILFLRVKNKKVDNVQNPEFFYYSPTVI